MAKQTINLKSELKAKIDEFEKARYEAQIIAMQTERIVFSKSFTALKHIVIWAIIFALGMFCGKMMNCDAAHKKMQQRFHPVFTNGCLDMQSIDNKKMQEALQKADVNADECISVEEYRAVKKEMRPMNKKGPRAQKSK